MKLTRLIIYPLALTLSHSALGQDLDLLQNATFDSLDGRTTLIVSGMHYYLGPKDHPNVKDFVKQYGQKITFQKISGGKCLSLGIFKLAVFEGLANVCQNVRIRRLNARSRNVSEYVATCYELKGDGCSSASAQAKPSLVYGYQTEGKLGITKIYLSDIRSRNSTNILVVKTGILFYPAGTKAR